MVEKLDVGHIVHHLGFEGLIERKSLLKVLIEKMFVELMILSSIEKYAVDLFLFH